MNSSKISKETENLTITNNSNIYKDKIKPKSNLNFLSVETHTNTFHSNFNNKNFDDINYRKTISYLRPYSIDLMKQSNLEDDKKIAINKNYFINLIKMRLKNKKTKLPTIQMLKTFSPKINKNFKAFSINVSNIKTFHSYQFPNFLNNTTNNSNKEKLNKLYKKIYEEKNNLKHIYVSQIINKNKSEKNESVNIKIKPKIINDINRNFITSEKRFMKYHGFNKRNKYKFNMNSYDKIKDKYYNVNSIKIIQLFLKKKLNIISKDVKTARNDYEIAKNDLISVYDSFNSQIQKKIDDVYSREDLYENLA